LQVGIYEEIGISRWWNCSLQGRIGS